MNLFVRMRTIYTGLSQARLSMLSDTPLSHPAYQPLHPASLVISSSPVEHFFMSLNDEFDTLVNLIKVSIGNNDSDFDNSISGLETSHLAIYLALQLIILSSSD